MTESISKRVVLQRIRNRIIEYFQIVVEYEADPGTLDLNDLINEWEMNVSHPFVPSGFPAPIFTPDETESMLRFDSAWIAFCNATPQSISDKTKVIALPVWAALVSEASTALVVFERRGRHSEEAEVL